jgi:hypothetical protein
MLPGLLELTGTGNAAAKRNFSTRIGTRRHNSGTKISIFVNFKQTSHIVIVWVMTPCREM